MIQVSIIIVNYNTADLVARSIESIYEHAKDLSFEIILIDNNSPDRSIEQVVACFPELKFIQLSSNIGFGKACNEAVKIAKAAFLFFLNSDAHLCNNAIKLSYDFYTQNEIRLELSCVGSQLINANGTPIHSYASFPKMKEYLRNKIHSVLQKMFFRKKLQNTFDTAAEFHKVDYITGANLLISRKNFDLVSGFDPAFFLYFEETDLQLRLAIMGKQSYVLKSPQIVHLQAASTQKNEALLRFYYYNSMHLYFKKHNNVISYLVFSFCWFFLDIKTVFQNCTVKRNSQ